MNIKPPPFVRWWLVTAVFLSITIVGDCAQERAFNNNFAEAAAWRFFQEYERWPTTIDELAAIARDDAARFKSPLRFKAEDYRSIDFRVLEDGKLQLTLTAHSGKTEIRVCEPPSIDATRVIREQGYLIIHDGSSFYYLSADGTFVSGPLNSWSGRVIEGTYQAEAPMFFKGSVTMRYINRPSAVLRYEMSFEINSVARSSDPFDSKNFAVVPGVRNGQRRAFPERPVFHKAYFAFSRLKPLDE